MVFFFGVCFGCFISTAVFLYMLENGRRKAHPDWLKTSWEKQLELRREQNMWLRKLANRNKELPIEEKISLEEFPIEEKIFLEEPKEEPKIGQIWECGELKREVVAIEKRSNRKNDYNIIWRRPGKEKTFVIWLPYWKKWQNKAILILNV